ncbi:MAG: P1 family peptidase [Candidatus Hodarchaeales archaeon]|jgi:D-aminopeptidase
MGFLTDQGIKIGMFERGKTNSIVDVIGVRVSHVTVSENPSVNTGVTAIIPREDNQFYTRPETNFAVFNGYGKSIGLMQVKELGEIETPIVLTNTLSTWVAADALSDWQLKKCQEEGHEKKMKSVNPVVLECNDAFLNDITSKHVTKEHVFNCLDQAWSRGNGENFERGDVGAGRGMSAFELKGGIGSSSRIVDLDGQDHVFGCLCLTNYGMLKHLTINGRKIGVAINNRIRQPLVRDHDGSVIILLATDAPLDFRQLGRTARRSVHGLARTGSFSSHSSGDIALAFTIADRKERKKGEIRESSLSDVFQATADLVEEAVLDSLVEAKTIRGYNGHVRHQIPLDIVLDAFQ